MRTGYLIGAAHFHVTAAALARSTDAATQAPRNRQRLEKRSSRREAHRCRMLGAAFLLAASWAVASWPRSSRAVTARSRFSATHFRPARFSRSNSHVRPCVRSALQSGCQYRRGIAPRSAASDIAAQMVGGIVGVLTAHVMFELPLWQVSTDGANRSGPMVRRNLSPHSDCR